MESIRIKLHILILILFIMTGIMLLRSYAFAHSPHDDISAIEVSPNYDEDKTVFIVLGRRVLKSTDGGHSWQDLANGLDNRYIFTSMSLSGPAGPGNTLFLSSRGDGLYKSIDNGASWIKVNKGLSDLKMDIVLASPRYPQDQAVLAAGSDGGLFISQNGGLDWSVMMERQTKITALAFAPEKNALRIFAGDAQGNFYSSTSNGKFEKSSYIENAGAITAISNAVPNSAGKVFFIGTEKQGVFKTTDRGITFSKSNNGIADNHILSVTTSPNFEKDTTVFASSWHSALFVSTDAGQTWQKQSNGLTTDRQADRIKYMRPHFKDIKCTKSFSEDKTIFLGGFDGLFKTVDAGSTWTPMEVLPVHIIKGIALSPTVQNRFSIAVATYGGGAYLSKDKGKTWTVCNMGLKQTQLYDTIFSPSFSADNLLFSTTTSLLYTSSGNGDRWSRTWLRFKDYQKKAFIILKRLGFSESWLEHKLFKKNPLRTLVTPNALGLSPAFKDDKTFFIGTRYHGILKSTDGGQTFSRLSIDIEDIHKKKVTSLALSPNFQKDSTLFAGIRWEGIFKSSDGGSTWQRKSAGIIFSRNGREVIPTHLVLAVSPAFQTDGTLFAGTNFGFFKTTNHGEHWEHKLIPSLSGNQFVKAIAVSPDFENDHTIVISIQGKGLFISYDKGEKWSEFANRLIKDNQSIDFIKFSSEYATDRTIVGASRSAIILSTDAGSNWQYIKLPVVRYENMRDVILYNGTWRTEKGEEFSATSISLSQESENQATFNFVGTGIKWIGTKSNNQGIAKVYIDGELKAHVDQYDTHPATMDETFSIQNLPYGSHTITVAVSDQKNPSSSGNSIAIDAFDVTR